VGVQFHGLGGSTLGRHQRPVGIAGVGEHHEHGTVGLPGRNRAGVGIFNADAGGVGGKDRPCCEQRRGQQAGQ